MTGGFAAGEGLLARVLCYSPSAMAPRRRKGGNQRNGKEQFSVGDLVLAKVKGYAAWPAKISRPEDWKWSHDPKKCFVQFFGTSEIAYVAPADIQVFTIESKSELHARAKRKHSKVFARAVEEICEAFEGLHGRTSDEFVKDINGATGNVKDNKLNESSKLEEPVELLTQKEKAKDECSHVELPGLKPFLQDHKGTFFANAQPDGSDGHEGIDASVSIKSAKSLYRDVQREERALISMSPSEHSSLKDEQLPSLFHEAREEDCIEICLESKELVHDLKVSAMNGRHDHFDGREIKDDPDNVKDEGFLLVGSLFNSLKSDLHGKTENAYNAVDSVTEPRMNVERISKLQKRYAAKNQQKRESTEIYLGHHESREQLIDKLAKEAVSSLDGRRENSSVSPVSGSNLSKEKGMKNSVEPEKRSYGKDSFLPGRSLNKARLDATKGQHTESSASLGDRREKKAKISKKKHKMDISEETQAQVKIMKKQRHTDDSDMEANTSGKSDSSCVARRKENKPLRKDTSTPSMKSTNSLPSTAEQTGKKVHLGGGESQLLLSRRHPQAVEASLMPTKSVENVKGPVLLKNGMPVSDYRKSPVHSNIRRRTFRIGDDEFDEVVLRTPVHKKTEDMLMAGVSNVSAIYASSQDQLVSPMDCRQNTRDTTTDTVVFVKLDEKHHRDRRSPAMPENDSLHQCARQTEENGPEKILEKHVSFSPRKLVYSSSSLGEHRTTPDSSKASTLPGTGVKLVQHKTIKQDKSSATASVKVKTLSSKHSSGNSGGLSSSYNPVTRQKMKTSSLEKLVSSQKNNSQMNEVAEYRSDANFSAERNMDEDMLATKRFDAMNAEAGNSMAEFKFTDSIKSMKHLIAVALAKRQACSQSLSHDNGITGAVSTSSVVPPRSPSPLFAAEHISTPKISQKDSRGSYANTSFASPSNISENHSLVKTVGCEEQKHLIIPVGQPPGGSMSGSTEAAIAHDALEGMIETLSRTKESIGRATRLAIDCAKYGIANQVVDLLIQKLESEPSFHRRVDLFFLVDSITQCSHGQKGIAEASYIPTVQAALPRLLSAAAPPGAGTHENRRQCHKVLRLWRERKIFPESLLRPFMDGIEVQNNDTSSGHFHRRPLRVERSIDDPIREIEGMLVDEYGSNVSFRLPGLLSMHIFEDEVDLPQTFCEDANNESTIEAGDVLDESDACMVSPTSRQHHVLEHVDGELEMEAVSASSKNGIATVRYSFNLEHEMSVSDRILESKLATPTEPPTLSDGSPHLPMDSPPPPPPLPSSPPPPLPPLPPSSPSPPSPPSIPPLPPMSHAFPPTAYHSSAQQNYYQSPSGRNACLMTEISVRQTPNFPVAGVSNTQLLPASFNPQFQPPGASFAQRSYHALPSGQTPSSFPLPASHVPFHHPATASQTPLNFPYVKPMVQYHLREQYYAYSFPPHPNGERHHVPEEHWRIHHSDANSVSWHGSWVTEGTAGASSQIRVQDGFLRSNVERPSHGFQLPSIASVAPVSVPSAHSVLGMAGYPHS